MSAITISRYKESIASDCELLQCHQNNMRNFRELGQKKELQREMNAARKTTARLSRNVSELKAIAKPDMATNKSLEKFIVNSCRDLEHFDQELKDVLSSMESKSVALLEDSQLPAINTDQEQLLAVDHMAIKASKEGVSTEEVQSLETSIQNLHSSFVEFGKIVHTQQNQIATIETSIENASHNVESGEKNLRMGLKLKAASLPIAGAAVGGLIGGPIGIALGTKIGVAAGATLGIVGGVLGGVFAKRQLTAHIDESPDAPRENVPPSNESNSVSQPSSSAINDEPSTLSSRVRNMFSYKRKTS